MSYLNEINTVVINSILTPVVDYLRTTKNTEVTVDELVELFRACSPLSSPSTTITSPLPTVPSPATSPNQRCQARLSRSSKGKEGQQCGNKPSVGSLYCGRHKSQNTQTNVSFNLPQVPFVAPTYQPEPSPPVATTPQRVLPVSMPTLPVPANTIKSTEDHPVTTTPTLPTLPTLPALPVKNVPVDAPIDTSVPLSTVSLLMSTLPAVPVSDNVTLATVDNQAITVSS